jgi:hypothetical protein
MTPAGRASPRSLLYLIAGWAIVRGLFEVVRRSRRREIDHEARGERGASIPFGIFRSSRPARRLAVLWVIGGSSWSASR